MRMAEYVRLLLVTGADFRSSFFMYAMICSGVAPCGFSMLFVFCVFVASVVVFCCIMSVNGLGCG